MSSTNNLFGFTPLVTDSNWIALYTLMINETKTKLNLFFSYFTL